MRSKLPSLAACGAVLLVAGCGALVGVEPIAYRDPSDPSDADVDDGATRPDGSRSTDASSDVDVASVDGDVVPRPELDCTGATFCDSFERTAILGPWDTSDVKLDATLSPSKARARSGAASLFTTLSASEGSSAYLVERLPNLSRFRLSFSVFSASVPGRSLSVGAVLRTSTKSLPFGLLFSSPARYVLVIGDTREIATFEAGRWVDLAFTFDLSSQRVTVTYDGKRFGESYSAALDPADLTLLVGAEATSLSGLPSSVFVDDVRVDAEP